ncbi:peptide chain release factor N(5)-glutamine methyltransferase [Alkaliphilus crotonatoxidans]
MVTAAQLIKLGTEELKGSSIDTPQLDAEVLLCYLLNIERIQLHIYPEREIAQEICQKFWEVVEKRKKQVPVQYLTNRQEFMGLDFYVDQRVLIPRGDTEILVEEVLRLYRQGLYSENVKLLDLGTGSGAIGLSLAKLIDRSQVTLVDISADALEVAQINADLIGVSNKVEFYHGDLFEALKGDRAHMDFHFVLSNPPYISRRVIETLSPQVKEYEPYNALDGGEDGLDFYRKIVERAMEFILPGGWLVVEIGFDQGPAVKELLEARGFHAVEIIRDLAGLDRVVKGTKPA